MKNLLSLVSIVSVTVGLWVGDAAGTTAIKVTDYGVVADDQGAATANVTAMRQLVAPAVNGGISTYTGTILFPGAAIYHFDDVIPIRDGIHLDLQGSTLHFNKVGEVSDRSSGFVFAIRDFSIENGSIVVDYDHTAGIVQAGTAIQLGTRASGSPYYFAGIYDSQLESPMGNLAVRNIDITMNHNGAVAYAILMFGGLDNVEMKNISINGQGNLYAGIFYEYGVATEPTDPPSSNPWQSSHARNMSFINISVHNLSTDGRGGVALHLGGASDTLVDGLYVDGAKTGFSSTHGEAAYYNTWRVLPEVPTITLRNLTMHNIYGHGLKLIGSSPFAGGYLADFIKNPTPEDQTDHLDYVVDRFSLQGTTGMNGAGINSSGRRLEVSNGTIAGFKWGILTNNDCTQIYIDNVNILESDREGVNLAYDNGVWDPPRLKTGHIKNSFLAGGGTATYHPIAILLQYVSDFLIAGNTVGYGNDPTQGNAVWLMEDVQHVVIYGNTVAGSTGAAYLSRSLADNNVLQSNRGITSAIGVWQQATNVYPTLVKDLTLGSNGDLEAVFSGDVTRYTWLKDGELLTYSDSSSLALALTKPEDFGFYQVVAKNGALATASSVVLVKLVP